MAPKLTDPNIFLTNLVSRKGKSDLYGVSLTGVNIVASATEDYGYPVSVEHIERDIQNLFLKDSNDWNALLVEARRGEGEIVYPISFHHGREPTTVYFISEGRDMFAMVFIPTLMVEDFQTEIVFFQKLVQEVAEFAGKTPTNIRFILGAATMAWDDLVESGCAKEVNVGF